MSRTISGWELYDLVLALLERITTTLEAGETVWTHVKKVRYSDLTGKKVVIEVRVSDIAEEDYGTQEK